MTPDRPVTTDPTPTSESYSRLARSSPWLWTGLDFTWVGPLDDARRRARVRRPGTVRVSGDGTSGSTEEIAEFEPWPPPAVPVHGPDGLVARRPERTGDLTAGHFDALFFDTYHWVAMLDPCELAATEAENAGAVGVVLTDVHATTHHGRPVWEAQAQSTVHYEPRCECCPLLPGHFDHDRRIWVPAGPATVRLDVETGVCVFIEDLEPGSSVSLDVEILAVTAERR